MDIVLNVAFVVAVVAFLKQQFGITGKVVLIWAFLICLLFGIAPLIMQAFPIVAPWVQVIFTTFTLFLAAAGSWDAVRSITRKQK
jgi:hypothetical protein